MDSVRAPLLGLPDVRLVLTGAAIITVFNVALGFIVFSSTRSRLPYWVA